MKAEEGLCKEMIVNPYLKFKQDQICKEGGNGASGVRSGTRDPRQKRTCCVLETRSGEKGTREANAKEWAGHRGCMNILDFIAYAVRKHYVLNKGMTSGHSFSKFNYHPLCAKHHAGIEEGTAIN